MAEKSVRQAFVERLAAVGIQIVNTASASVELFEALTDEQFAEFDQALTDLVDAGKHAALAEIPELPKFGDGWPGLPESDYRYVKITPAAWAEYADGYYARGRDTTLAEIPNLPKPDIDAKSWDEWFNKIVDGPMKMDRAVIKEVATKAHDAGMAAQRKAGLNDTGDLPSLDLPDVNAVDITITKGLYPDLVINVDGRERFKASKVDRLVINDLPIGARYVVLRDGQPLETIPNSSPPAPKPADDGLDV